MKLHDIVHEHLNNHNCHESLTKRINPRMTEMIHDNGFCIGNKVSQILISHHNVYLQYLQRSSLKYIM